MLICVNTVKTYHFIVCHIVSIRFTAILLRNFYCIHVISMLFILIQIKCKSHRPHPIHFCINYIFTSIENYIYVASPDIKTECHAMNCRLSNASAHKQNWYQLSGCKFHCISVIDSYYRYRAGKIEFTSKAVLFRREVMSCVIFSYLYLENVIIKLDKCPVLLASDML